MRGATFVDAEVTGMETGHAKDADLSGSSSRMAIGWVIFLSLAGLVALWVLVKVVARGRRLGRAVKLEASERAARLKKTRLSQEENVTRLGEEIDRLADGGEGGDDVNWHRALDAYDAAKQALAAARDIDEVKAVDVIVARGRDALRGRTAR